MLDKNHIFIANNKANVIFNAIKKRFIHRGERYVLGICLTAKKSLIDFRQALLVAENIPKQRIFV